MDPLALTSFTATSCIGRGVAATLATLRERRTGLAPCAFESVTLDTWVGEVAGVDEAPLPTRLREFECRNNRLAHLGLAQDGLAEAVQRAAEAGLIDAALVGGVDSLCLTTLYGFPSLQLVSRTPCRPFDVARDGISIGEAAAFALLERPGASLDANAVLLLGVGESSDAHHMSAPHPQGRGARAAMLQALQAAALAPQDIEYINFHGTGTPSNDDAEARAVTGVLGNETPGSSTKGATGHTLGAAGALEAVICALALRHGVMPAGVNTTEVDPALGVHYLRDNRVTRLSRVMSNSLGLGGSNRSPIFRPPRGARLRHSRR